MCSYCGCRSITVIGRYMAEHEDIVNLAGELRRAVERGEPEAVRAAADKVGAALHPHTRSEERSLFAQMRQDAEFTEHIDSLCGEHHELDAGLARVADGDHAAYPAFEQLLRHHIDREDNGLFPAAAIALDGPDWEWVTERA
ncbi:MAG TPA: hemerythrin domain-containing protein [Oryzihumus sp.]|nr:hemerythrin domain-containing protein [Oryzihumus sp.]